MDYLRIEEDGSLKMISGSDPEQDQALLQELEDGTVQVICYRGNGFMYLEVVGVEDGPEEDDPKEYDTDWVVIPREKK